ncbi:helix-turn-helix transcriptional regulator [Methylobacterium sp. Leaf88]|uniref:helix-turn-helix domain-containing protein n=1 Tax=Methylobacterium sp. Leaf88 TaxID=1736244 RepID=UPI000AC71758|nr:helix-turn-helix transcriptional regulator [Methylobacterium sp. Leaf88]
MTKRNLSLLKQRVSTRLSQLDMSPAEAARRGGLAKDFIYDILNERKKTVRADSIEKLARALDCDWQYLDGSQHEISIVDNIVDFDRPPVYIVGEVSPGVWLDKDFIYSHRSQASDMPTLPPDTRFPSEGQVDLYIRGNSINRFAPSGFILRCVLMDFWPELIRDGDLLIIDRFRNGLRERAAWRIRPTPQYIDFSSDTSDRKEQITWRAPVSTPENPLRDAATFKEFAGYEPDEYKPVAVAIFAYAESRIRRMF